MANKGKLSLKRKRYYTMIKQYQIRLAATKEKYGLKSERYKRSRIKLDKKIKIWKQAIRRIDNLHNKIHSIERAVLEFTGIRIIGQVHTPKNRVSEDLRLSKFLYYKFGLENGIRGMELREYMGVPQTMEKQPYSYRREFTNSFKTTPGNKEKWLQFKSFYERYSQSKRA